MKLNFYSETPPEETVIKAKFEPIGLLNASTFPSVGQQIYNNGVRDCLVIDSHASVTNMLESTIQLEGADRPIFADLPHIRLLNEEEEYLETSITLSHRLASSHLLANKSATIGGVRLSEILEREIANKGLHATVLYYCPLSLLHGAWFWKLRGGRAKIAKSISATLIAMGVKEALSGGLARDRILSTPSTLDLDNFDSVARASELTIGNIPHNTRRYFCDWVEGIFIISNPQISRLKVPDPGKQLILALAIYELCAFFESVPMHRVDCHLKLSEIDSNQPLQINGREINSRQQAAEVVEELLKTCRKEGIIGETKTVKVKLTDKITEPNKRKPKSKNNAHNLDPT